MKKNVMLAALMMVTTFLFAQRPDDRHHRADHKKKGHDNHMAFLKKELLLTDDQYAKVKSINENFAKQFAAIHKDTALSQGRARTLTQKLRGEQQTQLKGVLNEPQWAKLTEMKKGRGDKKGPRGQHGPHQRPGRGDARPDQEEERG